MAYIDGTKRDGWDDLYGDCFNGINKIIEDNLKSKHNKELIENIFSKMLKVLEKAILRMRELDGDEDKKKPWFIKAEDIKEFSKIADSVNKKVITINMIDQLLRSTY